MYGHYEFPYAKSSYRLILPPGGWIQYLHALRWILNAPSPPEIHPASGVVTLRRCSEAKSYQSLARYVGVIGYDTMI